MFDPFASSMQTAYQQQSMAFSEGLRQHMLRVYSLMGLALTLTAVVAFFTASAIVQDGQLTSLGKTLFASPLKWVVMLAPLGFVMAMGVGFARFSVQTLGLLFWGYAILNGVSLSILGLVFAKSTIAQAFAVTALTFGGMSLWGYTTKRDLTGIGSFAMMAVWGVFLAGLVNLFFQNSAVEFGISCVSVLAFTVLTAYDTQKIKEVYFQLSHQGDTAARAALSGALTLYIDFIALFVNMLQLMRGSDNR